MIGEPWRAASIGEVYVEGVRVNLDPTRSIGKGGEADVYDLGDGRALKVYKSPDHPDYAGLPAEQRAAEERIAIHQQKLRAFPPGLPAEVVAPQALATDRGKNRIVGYAMPLVTGATPLFRYGDPRFRHAGARSSGVVRLFQQLLGVLRALHRASVVVGDFNDANVLVAPSGPRLIDADSLQFGPFPCRVFTERFVDPLLCDAAAKAPRPIKPYGPDADWYAFNVLLLQSLLLVGPYGGIHRPADPARRVPAGERPLQRITIFHPEVQYPKPATPYRVLPDEVLHHFHRVFEKDARAPFPPSLLDKLAFSNCPICGAEHARATCPFCTPCSPSAPTAASHALRPVVVNGALRCERLFHTRGVILEASVEAGALHVVHHEDGAYRREDGRVVLEGELDPRLSFRILGKRTLFGRGGELTLRGGTSGDRILSIDPDGSGPAFDTNGRHWFWVQAGRLWRDAPSAFEPDGAQAVGEVLANQTRIFAGPTFGLGFYRAGLLARAFVFDAERRGINDDLRLPPLAGVILDATATLDEGRAWAFIALRCAGRVRHLCLVYSREGQLEATAEAEPGDGSWLATIAGRCASGGSLFAATDAGVVRVEVSTGTIRPARHFPATEAFVREDTRLLATSGALYAVGNREVLALQMT